MQLFPSSILITSEVKNFACILLQVMVLSSFSIAAPRFSQYDFLVSTLGLYCGMYPTSLCHDSVRIMVLKIWQN